MDDGNACSNLDVRIGKSKMMWLLVMFFVACFLAATIGLIGDAIRPEEEDLPETERCKCLICCGQVPTWNERKDK